VTVAHDVPNGQLDAVFDDLAAFEAHLAVEGFTLFEHRCASADGRAGADGGDGGDGAARWWPLRGYALAGTPAVPGSGQRR
jgi:hypothetical protein